MRQPPIVKESALFLFFVAIGLGSFVPSYRLFVRYRWYFVSNIPKETVWANLCHVFFEIAKGMYQYNDS